LTNNTLQVAELQHQLQAAQEREATYKRQVDEFNEKQKQTEKNSRGQEKERRAQQKEKAALQKRVASAEKELEAATQAVEAVKLEKRAAEQRERALKRKADDAESELRMVKAKADQPPTVVRMPSELSAAAAMDQGYTKAIKELLIPAQQEQSRQQWHLVHEQQRNIMEMHRSNSNATVNTLHSLCIRF
jgi:chromosome segregation ATPase